MAVFSKGIIRGNVWEDTNNDGLQDLNEPGKMGVIVKLYANNNGQPGALIATTTSDIKGNYDFSNFDPGSYIAQFISADGSVLTQSNVGNDDSLDSDANSNGNGIQDNGETGLGNVTVKLLDSSGNVLQTTTTDSNGAYSFSADPGSYKVQVVAPGNYHFSAKDQGGNDATDSDVNTNGISDVFTVTSGQINGAVDAGLKAVQAPNGTIQSLVWTDTNGNGIQDGGETGLSNVTVRLLDSNGNEVARTNANGDGDYTFNPAPGSYRVEVIKPDSNFRFSAQDQGSNDAVDSDVYSNRVIDLDRVRLSYCGMMKSDRIAAIEVLCTKLNFLNLNPYSQL